MFKHPLVRICVGVVLFGLVFFQIGIPEATSVLSEASVQLIVLVALLNLPILALVTLRAGLLLRQLGHAPPLDVLFSASTVGYVIGALTPAASGEVLRVQALQQSAGVPVRTGVMLIAFERLLSFYLLCLSTAFVAASLLLPWQQSTPLLCLLAVGAVFPIFAGRLGRLVPAARDEAAGPVARASRFIREAATDLESLLSDRLSLVFASGISIAIFGLVALQFWLLAEAVQAAVGPEVGWLSFGLSQIAGIASMLPFGVGVQDGSLTAVLSGFDVASETGLAVALLVRMAVTLPLVVAALLMQLYLALPRGATASSAVLSVEKP